jgi:hypothetical protein
MKREVSKTMLTQELSGRSLAILSFLTVAWGAYVLIQTQLAKNKMGDLLATYMGDVLPLLIVMDVAKTRIALALGLFGCAIKLGMTILRARKLKKEQRVTVSRCWRDSMASGRSATTEA